MDQLDMEQTVQNLQTMNHVVTTGSKISNIAVNEVRNMQVANTGLNTQETGHVTTDAKNFAESFVRN